MTDVETQENTLVVENPAGGGIDPCQVDTPPSTLESVKPLPSTSVKVDTPIESLPSTSTTHDMPNGMTNVQQLRDGTFVVCAKWYHYARVLIPF